MKTSVQRWGNSLAVRIPRSVAAETKIAEGVQVDLLAKGGNLVVRPIRRKPHSLAELVKRITPSNRHGAVDTGPAVGGEAW